MCYFSPQDQYVCQSNQGIAEAVTSVLGGAQFPSGPFYHPRSSRCRFGHPREAAVCAGNFPDSNGISDDFKRQNRSHHTEPVPASFVHPFRSKNVRSKYSTKNNFILFPVILEYIFYVVHQMCSAF